MVCAKQYAFVYRCCCLISCYARISTYDMENLSVLFCSSATEYIRQQTEYIKKCVGRLSDEQVWHQPNEAANSIANLILHLCGNTTQYILSSLGGRPDERQRDLEFSIRKGYSKISLLQQLNAVVTEACKVIEQQSTDSLMTVRSVQGFQKTGLSIILHVTEHFSYHTGQIALLTKLMTNEDLGFYKGLDLNRKNG